MYGVKRIRKLGGALLDRMGERLLGWRLEVEIEKRRRLETQRDALVEQRDKARQERTKRREERDRARGQRDKAREDLARLKEERKLRGNAAGKAFKPFNYHVKQKEWVEKVKTLEDMSEAERLARGLEDIELFSGKRDVRLSKIYPARITPPDTVAFVTVANDRFIPGLELLISTLLDVYPNLDSDIIVFNDGTINEFAQRRIQNLYKRCKFVVPDMSWLKSIPSASDNQKRIGILGYMNVMAASLDYDRVIMLDSDVVILDDISALWTGKDVALGSDERFDVDLERVIVCHDYGARPFVAKSFGTDRYIINSGVISLPRSMMNASSMAELQDLVNRNSEKICPLLDRFADQKVWNRFLADKDICVLPANFNCNVKLLDSYLEGRTEFLRIVHFTGQKPWFSPDYLDPAVLGTDTPPSQEPSLWKDLYRTSMGRRRLGLFNKCQPNFPPRLGDETMDGVRTCIFMGNGPSLKQTPIDRFGSFERFAFNWFILHEKYDEIKPENLVLASHMLFGGWNHSNPKFPDAYLSALLSRKWRPTIWTSFYFREYMEMAGITKEFDVKYILFEKPFKDFIDRTGYISLDVHGYMQDGRTGVLSMAAAVAAQKGYEQIALVGCDSNYNQPGQADNYFYPTELHASESTRTDSLTATWVADGPGDTSYLLAQATLADRGCRLVDYTIGGRLPLPKGDMSELLRR